MEKETRNGCEELHLVYIIMYCIILSFCSFIRLCDYLVITMLHRMSVFSAKTILGTLECQTNKATQITDLVKPIPESTEEQEKLLQVCLYSIYVCT